MSFKKGNKNTFKHGDDCRSKVAAEYRAWYTMKRRCYDKSFINYPNYGERGINVCPEWLDKESGYVNFLKDVGRKPSKKYTLDRINVNGNYTPENTRWATPKMQARNKTDTIYLTYKGVTKCLPDWAEKYSMKKATLYNRLYRSKLPLEIALETPVGIGEFKNNNSKKTKCPKGHPYSGENLIKDGKNRKCRICTNEKQRTRRSLRKNNNKNI